MSPGAGSLEHRSPSHHSIRRIDSSTINRPRVRAAPDIAFAGCGLAAMRHIACGQSITFQPVANPWAAKRFHELGGSRRD
jgi:hypothetical protein